ncbi:hypothetical protein D4740_00935 [Actinomyces sp. 2119]|uniref:Uncharacterized protein n=1 Tax=Actinomyces lilanjuaniae TaxID=2321394 RepID=A0ABM6Z4D4_9ACTO|nr:MULTISPECIES: hypothetical protein [Actinomyces]AYD89800.1 hypothetical protein D5R93_06665 [Actinomyces lilanjuaniae]RJF44776.1 hypothetical protein D4740_00935 [Actinomyces sp. 2119]
MMIDWASLAQVTVVTILGAAVVVVIVSLAARLLDVAHARRRQSRSRGLMAAELGAGACFLLAGAITLYGIWLIIPYFH